ncbi:hypothetical protein BH11PSE9_BH11PSE9_08560 [soil metagenome]
MNTHSINTNDSIRSVSTSRAVFGLSAIAMSLALAACGPQNGAPVAGTAAPVVATAPAPVVQQVPAPAPAPMPAPVVVQQQAPAAPAPTYVQQPVQYAPAQRVAQAEPERARPVASNRLGEVRHIEEIRTRPKGSGTGAVIGGVLGGLVGNQFGHGGGKAATTVLGAAGGAVAGNNIERNRNEGVSGYRVTVQLDNGQSRTFQESRLDGLRIGDRVRIDNGNLHRV